MRLLPAPSRLACLAPCLAALLAGACAEEAPSAPAAPGAAALAAVAGDPGVPRDALALAVDATFTREDVGETRALLVLHEGRIVAERYAEGFDAETRFVGWSMAKTVTAVLIGLLVADGRLALDSPAPVESWQRAGDPRGEITLRHLLQMRSGLRHEEKAEPIYTSPEVRMMFLDGREDMAGWAEAQPLAHAPGSAFQYSTNTSVILADIAADTLAPGAGAATRQQAMAQFIASRLARPLGMESLVGEYDATGTLAGGSFIWANARDWARFGEFLRNDGRAGGMQVVPRGWIAFMREPSPRSPDYGGQLWLNRASGEERDMLFAEEGPADAYAAIGHLGQYVIVVPGRQLTIVRLGKTDEEARPALVDALADIATLYPER